MRNIVKFGLGLSYTVSDSNFKFLVTLLLSQVTLFWLKLTLSVFIQFSQSGRERGRFPISTIPSRRCIPDSKQAQGGRSAPLDK